MDIRPVRMEDFEAYYRLKCEPENIAWSGFACPPDRDGLYAFFKQIVENQQDPRSRKLYIVRTDDGEAVGEISIKYIEEHVCEIPLTLKLGKKQRGYAKKMLRYCFEEARKLGYTRYEGYIREDNQTALWLNEDIGATICYDRYKMEYIPDRKAEVKMFYLYKNL